MSQHFLDTKKAFTGDFTAICQRFDLYTPKEQKQLGVKILGYTNANTGKRGYIEIDVYNEVLLQSVCQHRFVAFVGLCAAFGFSIVPTKAALDELFLRLLSKPERYHLQTYDLPHDAVVEVLANDKTGTTSITFLELNKNVD